MELEKGKHTMKVGSERLEVGGNKIEAEKLKKLLQDMEIVIVAKEKLEEYRNIISQKDIGYLFYIDKEKVENMLKDKEKLEDIKLRGNNPFRIGKQEFYIPQDGNYLIKAMMKPKRDFLLKDFVGSNINIIKASLEAISGWDIEALNCRYKQNISEDGMHIDAYFHRRGDIKESIILSKKFSNINIKEKPYLAFSCEMNDVDVQEIELDIMTSDPSNKKVKKITLRADNKQYVINLYEKAKKAIGDRREARGEKIDLFVNEVVLKFKKKDGLDLSRGKNRRIYSFVFKNLAFLKTPPIIAEFKDELITYLPDYYYYFDSNGDLKRVDFSEQVPWDIKDVYRLHLNRFIDLKETPVLSLSFPRPVWGVGGWRLEAEGRDGFPSEWKVILGIDFDGDEKEDSRIEAFVPASGLVDGKLLLTVRAYEIARERFPDKKAYNLLSIGISHPEDKEDLYQTVMSKKLIRYRERISKAGGVRLEAKGAGVLEVDGKIYKLPPKAKGVRQKLKDEENNWVEFNNIRLEEGEHSLKVLENDKFKVEMVEIKPISSISSIGFISSKERQEPPKIEFKKINPTRYVVNVKGAKNPFTLVFSESFHEGWKAYIRNKQEVRGGRLEARDWGQKAASNLKPLSSNNEPWSALWTAWKDKGKRIEIKDHFVVNGYANGWIVPIEQMLEVRGQRLEGEKRIPENFEIVLEFKPQRLFEVGVIISATTLLGCIGYIGYDFSRRRKNKRFD